MIFTERHDLDFVVESIVQEFGFPTAGVEDNVQLLSHSNWDETHSSEIERIIVTNGGPGAYARSFADSHDIE